MRTSLFRGSRAFSLTCGFFLLSAFLNPFFIDTASAQSTGKLSVTIEGKSSGVEVEISRGNEMTPLEKKVSKSGVVTFTGLEADEYVVTPRKSGIVFSPQTRRIAVVAGKTKRTKITASTMPAKVGMSYCMNCHDTYRPEVYADWLKSPHANFQYVDASHHEFSYSDFLTSFSYPSDYTKFTGFPTTATFGTTPKYCRSCHGPSKEDNKKVAGFPLVKADGTVDPVNHSQVARPIVGCEACHGGGTRHIASPFARDLPYSNPSAVQCGECHNKDFPTGHLIYHPAGAGGENNPGIYEAYQASPHINSVNQYVIADAKKGTVTALCSKCHTDQGARLYKDRDGDSSTLPALFTGEAALPKGNAVQCRTCHNAHNPSELLESATAATGTATARSAEFNTCTNCHQLLTATDTKITPFHSSHASSITTNHYDDPATQALEGYNVNRGKDSACSDCHNPHGANLEINKEYAESGHGELSADPWSHYDWKVKTGTAQRLACQQCHTTTGFVSYTEDPVAAASTAANPNAYANYALANNDFSHLSGKQLETLYCNGCHTDSAFNRRQVPSVIFPSGLSASLGDDSNLCMVCHQGRASKVHVDNNTTGSSFNNNHYLAAAASLFGTEVKGGYEYSGKTYVGRNMFVGHNGKMDTCVKCHMRKDTEKELDHHFMPEVADCATCHTGITHFSDIRPANVPDYDGDGNTTEGLEAEITTFQEQLLPQIVTYSKNTAGVLEILYDGATSPYWFCAKNGVKTLSASGKAYCDHNGNGIQDGSPSSSTNPEKDGGYNKFDAKLLRAAYNYHSSLKEPGGFIHNHTYYVELLFDSIQDLGGSVAGKIRP